MSATFCFTDRTFNLFVEACVRGYLAAILDYPRTKEHEACTAQAMLACEALRPDVCCIQDEDAYQQLVVSAWVASYVSFARDVPERDIVLLISILKRLPYDEALRHMRPSFTRAEARVEMERGYGQFVAATSARS